MSLKDSMIRGLALSGMDANQISHGPHNNKA